MQTTVNRFIVGDYTVDPQLNRITGPERVSVIEPKVMHVLTCMASQPGSVLTKDELIEEVWEGTVVTDYVVSRSISQLRKIFSDSYKAPRYIETVSKTGYRLIAPVSLNEYEQDSASSLLPFGDSRPVSEAEIEVAPSTVHSARTVAKPYSKTPSKNGVILGLSVCLIGLLSWSGFQFLSGQPSLPLPATLLTSTPGLEMSPSFSPDGSMVVFVRLDPKTRLDIYIKMIDGQTELRLTDHPGSDGSPVWSADGRSIIFQRFDQAVCSIHEIPPQTDLPLSTSDFLPAYSNRKRCN